MSTNRREFIFGSGLFALAATTAGCRIDRIFDSGGAPMAGFAAPKIENVRIGFVGVGERGIRALRRLSTFPGVTVAAVCEINPEAVKAAQAHLAERKLAPAKEFIGPEAYKNLCQWDGVDVVYACTPWELHEPVAVEAMENGKHSFVEVPATMTIDGCWNLVETSERTRRHCMMLENCCYGETELLALNLCRRGILGETVYGEAAYRHSGATRGHEVSKFRAAWYQKHRGNYYPTHGLGPVAQYMNINRGDRFDYLVSVEGKSVGDYIREGDVRWNGNNLDTYRKYLIGAGGNQSIIKTMNGKTIFLDIGCNVPRPYSRLNTIQGTHGTLMDYPLRIMIEKEPGSGPEPFSNEKTEEYRKKYMHPMWKDLGELAKRIGGHGGMDFIMDVRWVYCLQNGLPLDQDVYDLASWSCLCEVSEESQGHRSKAVDIPDFTRGAWRTMKPLDIVTVDPAKMGFKGDETAGEQLSV